MVTRSDKKRLEEIRERKKKAWPGPWEYTPDDEFDDWTLYNPKTTEYIKQDDSGVPIAKENGEFIAASRSDIPFLLDLVERLDTLVKDQVQYVGEAGTRACDFREENARLREALEFLVAHEPHVFQRLEASEVEQIMERARDALKGVT